MNDVIIAILLFATVIALQYNAWVMAGALLIAALLIGKKKLHIFGGGAVILLLKLFEVPSWEVLSLVVIAILFSLIKEDEPKPQQEGYLPYYMGGVPPEGY